MTDVEEIARLMDRAERILYLRARGWHCLSFEGAHAWRPPHPTDPHEWHTLAAAVRIALANDIQETP